MSNDLIPLLAFFLAFFATFLIIELLIIYTLNILQKKYWEFVINKLMRLKVHHGRAIEIVSSLLIILIIALIALFTPFIDVFDAAKPIIKTFSLILLIVMVVVYFVSTRKTIKMAMEKKMHQYIYFLISIILFPFMVMIADQSYNAYQNYINTQFVDPATQKVQSVLDSNEEDRLLTQFREEYLAGNCEEIDYNELEGDGLKHFVLIRTDADLASNKNQVEINTETKDASFLKGHNCSDDENTFLLTEEGKWYWVISE